MAIPQETASASKLVIPGSYQDGVMGPFPIPTYAERSQIMLDHVLPREEGNVEKWHQFLDDNGLSHLKDIWTPRKPRLDFCMEYGLPFMGADGGLGYLEGDAVLKALELNEAANFIGLLYGKRKAQRITFSGNTGNASFEQIIDREDLPTPAEMGLKRLDGFNIKVHGEFGRNNQLEVYEYPGSNSMTRLLLLNAGGEVYEGSTDSNARFWQMTMLGAGGAKLAWQMKEKGVVDDYCFTRINESQSFLGSLFYLAHRVAARGDTEQAFNEEREALRAVTLNTNHTLSLAAETVHSQYQVEKFVAPNLKDVSEITLWKFYEFIGQRGGQLRGLDAQMWLSGLHNGVAEDHARLSNVRFQEKYGKKYYGVNVDFKAVTNGVTAERWNSRTFNKLKEWGVLDQYGMPVPDYQDKVDAIPDEEIIANKKACEDHAKLYLRSGLKVDQYGRAVHLEEQDFFALDTRRVAGYKLRWTLLADPDRLRNILEAHPNAHFIVSGKAHPKDDVAVSLLNLMLQEIDQDDLFRERIHYLADYNDETTVHVAPGARVETNTPLRGMEACATSFYKPTDVILVSEADGGVKELTQGSYNEVKGEEYTPERVDEILVNLDAAARSAKNLQEFVKVAKKYLPEHIESYYEQLESALADAEDGKRFVAAVKRLWKGNFLEKASAARMERDYARVVSPNLVAEAAKAAKVKSDGHLETDGKQKRIVTEIYNVDKPEVTETPVPQTPEVPGEHIYLQ